MNGSVLELKAKSPYLIGSQIEEMMRVYSPEKHLSWMEDLENYALQDSKFVHFIGRCNMQPYAEDAPILSLI